MPSPRFIHLRTHSQYSLLEGALRIEELPRLLAHKNMPALALTDTNNLFGALEFSHYMAKENIQPILGIELEMLLPAGVNKKAKNGPLIFLAQNEVGYKNLLELSAHYFIANNGQTNPISLNKLAQHAEGIITLSGGADGILGNMIRAHAHDAADVYIEKLLKIFGDRLYIEIERHPTNESTKREIERETEPKFLDWAKNLNIPLVATNNALFPEEDFYEAHDAMICIGDSTYVDQRETRRSFTPHHYLKSAEEMIALFADLPEAINNTVEIAQRCAFMAYTRKPILPKYADNEVEELRKEARDGLKKRLEIISLAAPIEEYEERLEFELDVIEQMKFPGYFLIVADFIKWAKSKNIPVGLGRGSGAGSLVAYSLTITDLDPLRFGLLFERFLNPERVSMPDFDIDFCQERREEVINYVQQKYGRDRVAQIITFGALMSKAAIRDIGRVLQIPYGQVDRISKLIPLDGVKPLSIKEARKKEPQLNIEAEREEVVARMLDIADKVEGLYRNASTHAAGVVIADRPVQELVPLYQDPSSDMPATGFNMKWVEPAGLVKFDFLGLKTLTVVKNAVDLLKKRGINLDIDQIPLNDPATFALYSTANTIGVFQVESPGMRDALRQMKPTTIEDIVALVSLYRPGPMDSIPKFCKVKNNLEEREFIHPLIDKVLDETQGIIIYQEQVMEIARLMSGYTLGGADILRRAMGKKNKDAMDAERPKFIDGAAQNGVDAKKATEVFDLLEKFANYGFNKSHAAAYAILSYQTAYLKANYPVEFMAAIMNGDMNSTDKLATFTAGLNAMGIKMVPPNINISNSKFDVEDSKVLYALGALKNVGVDAMETIVQERSDNGAFKSLFDFSKRVNLRQIGKRALEMLARAGAFDELEPNRNKVLINVETLIRFSATTHEERNSAQNSLFDGALALEPPKLVSSEPLLLAEKLSEEALAIGFYISGHPLDSYRAILKRQSFGTLSEVAERATTEAFVDRIAGTISSRQDRTSARGTKFAFIELSDPTGKIEMSVQSKTIEKYNDLLQKGNNIVAFIEVSEYNQQLRMSMNSAMNIEDLEFDRSKTVCELELSDVRYLEDLHVLITRLEKTAKKQGELRAVIKLLSGEKGLFSLGDNIPLSSEAIEAIRNIPGVISFEEI